jgi:hypothetical protein
LQLHQGQGAALHHSKAITQNHMGFGYPLNTPGLVEIICTPLFHLITIFAPLFLAGYQHHGMKEQWHKSDSFITAIAPGAQLL